MVRGFASWGCDVLKSLDGSGPVVTISSVRPDRGLNFEEDGLVGNLVDWYLWDITVATVTIYIGHGCLKSTPSKVAFATIRSRVYTNKTNALHLSTL